MKWKQVLGALVVVPPVLCVSIASLYIVAVKLNSYVSHVVQLRDVDLGRIRVAERCLEAGKAREALAVLEPVEMVDSSRGCHIMLIRASACCMLNGDCKRIQDEMEMGRFTTKIFCSAELRDRLIRYCDYTCRRRGPQAAAALIDGAMYMDLWLSPCCDLQLLQAQYCLESGDRKRAARMCQRLWDDGLENNWNWIEIENDSAFRAKLRALKGQAGRSDEKWLMARELQKFPENSVIYLQPLGELNMKLLEDVRVKVQDFFGTPVAILPTLTLTRQEPSYMKGDDKYNVDQLCPDMLKRLRIPANAFSVVMITQENIGTPQLEWVFSQSSKNGHLVSYCKWRGCAYHWQVYILGNLVVSCVSKQLQLRGNFPCVTASTGDRNIVWRMKFAYSPEIQEKYRSIDLEAAKAQSIADYKEAGATIVAP